MEKKTLIQILFSYDKKPQARVLVSVAKESEKPTIDEKMEVEDIERESLEHLKPTIRENRTKKYKKTVNYDMQKFPGKGNRLGDK